MIDRKQLQPIIEKLQKESDRACAVLSGATLDVLLESLLSQAMLRDSPHQLFDGTGALATFSAKIDIAYAFGLIGTQERADLHIIRKIRNDFAHAVQYELSFLTEAIANRVRSLIIPKLFEGDAILADNNDTIRWRFELCVGVLATSLSDFRIPNALRAARPQELSKC